MPKIGRVCTHCTRRLTDPCDGENEKCPYRKSKRRNLRWAWGLVLVPILLLLFSCEPEYYDTQLSPSAKEDRDTGWVVVFNRWAHLPDDTMPVIRIKGTFYEPACINSNRQLLPITAPVMSVSYKVDAEASKQFEKCK